MQARRREVIVKQIALPLPLTGPEQPLGLFAGAVTERTKVIAFSHVQYDDGAVLPVKELCAFARQKGILSMVDGAQALGIGNYGVRAGAAANLFSIAASCVAEAVAGHPPRKLVLFDGKLVARDGSFLAAPISITSDALV